MVGNPGREYAVQRRDPIDPTQDATSFCCGWRRRPAIARRAFSTFKQALELGGNVRKGERGTKVYFVKQLQVRDQGADDSSSTRLSPR